MLGAADVLTGDAISDDFTHDEALTATWHAPDVVVRPSTAADVAAVVGIAAELGVPVTHGQRNRTSGACIPRHGGILVSFDRMASILEIDTENHVPSCSQA